MQHVNIKTILVLVLSFYVYGSSQKLPNEAILYGPTWKLNFGSGKSYHTFGFQIHHHYLSSNKYAPLPFSYGGGMDFSVKNGSTAYLDLQSGIIYIGGSAGIAYNTNHGTGFQATMWGNALLGADYTYRSFDGGTHATGAYISLPYFIKD